MIFLFLPSKYSSISNFIQRYSGILRGFKPFYWLYNLSHKKDFAVQRELLQRYGIHRRYWQSIAHKDLPVHEPFQPTWDIEGNVSDNELIVHWQQNGYLVLEKLFDESEVDALCSEIATLHDSNKIDYNYTGTKMVQVHEYSDEAKKMMCHPILLKNLELLLDRKVMPFHSIYFNHGSEQAPHSDNIHMATFPKGFLIAAWIALEDINEGSGELLIYSGSHKLPYIYNEDYRNHSNTFWTDQSANEKYETKIQTLLDDNGLVGQKYLAKKGDVLLWHANLIHGGNVVKNREQTRKSIVFHYFGEGVLCYHEISQRLAKI